MLTEKEKVRRGFWFTLTLAVSFIFLKLANIAGLLAGNSDIVNDSTTLVAFLSLIVALIAAVLTIYQLQWIGLSESKSYFPIVFRLVAYPLLAIVIPLKIAYEKLDVAVESANIHSLMLSGLIVAGGALYFSLQCAPRAFASEEESKFNDMTPYERRQMQNQLFWFHLVIVLTVVWIVWL